ncbi:MULTISPECIES: ExbD/TolR family protein [Chromobacteriaceae]|uniref:Biopolymer transporter ExbD n=3 Tax=Chromobacteriaceae TaxID=1499392 RepID=A0ABV0H288_9NEIS|nr:MULTISPECIES: biopolymer transporter ExbD [Chromobacteriaceae]AVG18179.1 biopolymer transporter ExbD [Chromobacterium vaccinii]ERE20272.1 biopolymer transporter ExbD [Pseudogulbenkiania ferrooxidans EGD-HP2]MBX9299372.1 biopolymer transporter ExbD [Chromobacterium vaccinii]MBX9345510.1 biopolymer transporter ExbD [Chromobacterium vaccinii]MBX9356228.1 biopolymer transporter ExbD [Chromobacterium vaccinii]
MDFRRGRAREEPEINFIPLIDVLLVILIFLMVTTTYSHFSELKINLPTAQGEQQQSKTVEIKVAVAADGAMAVNDAKLPGGDKAALLASLKAAAAGKRDVVVVVNADARSTHQSVIAVMEAAREAGLSQLTFATQNLK